MSEAGDDEAKYRIRWEADGKVTNSSRDRTGKASAEYFNGDKYEGEYVNGVSFLPSNLNKLLIAKVWKRALHMEEWRRVHW